MGLYCTKLGKPQVGQGHKGPFIPSVSINAAMTLAILISLKTMEWLENGLQPQSGGIPLFSMRAVSLELSQR